MGAPWWLWEEVGGGKDRSWGSWWRQLQSSAKG
jgi:hypothetical protein